MYGLIVVAILILAGIIGYLWFRSSQSSVTDAEAEAVDAIAEAAPALTVPIGKDPDANTRPAYTIS